jgi:hypothetical protein
MIKVICVPNFERALPLPPDEELEKVLEEAGCKLSIHNHAHPDNPFTQRVFVCEKMPRPMLIYGLTWKELKDK